MEKSQTALQQHPVHTQSPKRHEIAAKIAGLVATTIGLAPSELGPRDSLVDNYGMESLDLLDISFRVNKEFHVTLFRGDFLQRASDVLGGLALVKEGLLTEAGVMLLKERLPEVRDNPILRVGATKSILARLYCVDSFVRQVSELHEADQPSGAAFLDGWLARYREKL